MYARARLFERLQLGALHLVATSLAALAAMWIRHAFFDGVEAIPWRTYVLPALLAGLLVAVVLNRMPARPRGFLFPHLDRLLRGVVIATGILLALSFFYRGESYSRASVLFFVPLAGLGLMLAERTHLFLVGRIRKNAFASRRMLLVGLRDQGTRIAKVLADASAYIDVIGYVDDSEPSDAAETFPPRLGDTSHLVDVIEDTKADLVLITSDSRSNEEIEDLIGVCMACNRQWILVPPILDLVLDRIRVEYIGDLPVVSERGSHLVGHDWFIKRSFDILVSSVLLLVLSPVLLAAALAVRLASPGPVVFRQKRVGIGGRLFVLLKFRTMYVGSNQETHEEYARRWIVGQTAVAEASPQPKVHKLQRDPRITPVGRILRASSIDELPQLWNVLRGDMSLVGPRPPIPYEVLNYSEWHRRRLAMPPGVTGLWQVSGRNQLSFDEMVRLDLDYIEGWSLGLDINILLQTVPAVVLHRGS